MTQIFVDPMADCVLTQICCEDIVIFHALHHGSISQEVLSWSLCAVAQTAKAHHCMCQEGEGKTLTC